MRTKQSSCAKLAYDVLDDMGYTIPPKIELTAEQRLMAKAKADQIQAETAELKRQTAMLARQFSSMCRDEVHSIVVDAFARYVGDGLRYTVAYRACIKYMRDVYPKLKRHKRMSSDHIEEYYSFTPRCGAIGENPVYNEGDEEWRMELAKQPKAVRELVRIAKREARLLATTGYSVWDFGATPLLQGKIRDCYMREMGHTRYKYLQTRKRLIDFLRWYATRNIV